jgi:hypothetical protein
MTRKHFVKVAAILAGDLASAANDGERNKVKGIAYSLADMFQQENGNFDRDRFYAAVGM